MLAVAVLAVLAGMAAPSFKPLVERWRVRQTVEGLQSILFTARSEAIKRGGNVVLMKLANNDNCANATNASQWGCGWKLFVDANGNGAQDTGAAEATLQFADITNNLEVDVANSAGSSTMRSYITIDRWGQLDNNGTKTLVFRVKPQGKASSDSSAAALCVGLGGRIKRLTKGDGTC